MSRKTVGTIGSSRVYDQDCASVVDPNTVPTNGRSHDGEITGIGEVADAAVDELVADKLTVPVDELL